MPYTLPSGVVLPSVTEILKATQTKKQREQLQKWVAENPGVGETSSNRGNKTHSAVAAYLNQPQPRLPLHPGLFPFNKVKEREHYRALYQGHLTQVPEIATGYYRSILPYLMEIERCYWVEHQINGENSFLWSKDGYAGRPDIICDYEDEITLIDLKTCDGAYHRRYQKDGGAVARFTKAATQLVAYAHLCVETLGFQPAKLIIMVAQPNSSQLIELTTTEIFKAEKRWRKHLAKFKKMTNSV